MGNFNLPKAEKTKIHDCLNHTLLNAYDTTDKENFIHN